MKFLEKVAFIEKSLHLNDYAFCTRYRIKISNLKKWRKGLLKPTAEDVYWVCNYFHLDANDFLDDNSTLSKKINEGEHPCLTKPVDEKPNTIYEDFVREDNSRYEEKD